MRVGGGGVHPVRGQGLEGGPDAAFLGLPGVEKTGLEPGVSGARCE